MTFWDFLDKQFARIRADGVAGAGIFVLTGVVLLIIVEHPELAENDLFKTIAQGIVLQGLIGLAMAAWFTKRNGPQETVVVNPPSDPVHAKLEGEGE